MFCGRSQGNAVHWAHKTKTVYLCYFCKLLSSGRCTLKHVAVVRNKDFYLQNTLSTSLATALVNWIVVWLSLHLPKTKEKSYQYFSKQMLFLRITFHWIVEIFSKQTQWETFSAEKKIIKFHLFWTHYSVFYINFIL